MEKLFYIVIMYIFPSFSMAKTNKQKKQHLKNFLHSPLTSITYSSFTFELWYYYIKLALHCCCRGNV